MDEQRHKETSAGPHAQKKLYQKPTLIRWGSLRDLTMTNGKSGNWDGGLVGRTRTGRGGHHVIDATF